MSRFVIPADPQTACYGIAEPLDAGQLLGVLQRTVGGYIEIVPCGRLQLVVHDEGRLAKLPVNERATALLWTCDDRHVPWYVHGDAVVVGPTDGEGEIVPLDLDTLRRLDAAFTGVGDFAFAMGDAS